MGTRKITIRIDEETERTLEELRRATGLSSSEILKRGILALREEIRRASSWRPFQIYRELDLGEGGYAIASSTNVRRGVRKALKRKHGR